MNLNWENIAYHSKTTAMGTVVLAAFFGVYVVALSYGMFGIFLSTILLFGGGYAVGEYMHDKYTDWKFAQELDSFEEQIRDALHLRFEKKS